MITEARKAELLKNIEDLEAYQELQNLMGRAAAAFNFRQSERILDSFALEEASVSLEYADEGVFQGAEAVTAGIDQLMGMPARPGEMMDLQLTTPMIEVAGDGKSAEGVWWCPGAGALVKDGMDPQAVWIWGMVAADFLKVQGEWKIWHLHYFRYMKCDYKKGWVEDVSMEHRPNTAMHPLAGPTTYHNPYTPTSVREGIPACPRPYKTYTGTDWMLNRDKTK